MISRVYYRSSTLLCPPDARSQPGGHALGAQAGEAAIRSVVPGAGFGSFRRATETPSTWCTRLDSESRP